MSEQKESVLENKKFFMFTVVAKIISHGETIEEARECIQTTHLECPGQTLVDLTILSADDITAQVHKET